MPPKAKMPVRYGATIDSPGQCRDNLKTFRGVWRIAFSKEEIPYDEDEEEEEKDDEEPARVVLTHRLCEKNHRETWYFGQAKLSFLCGDTTHVDIQWTHKRESVPVEGTDLAEAMTPDNMEAEVWNCHTGGDSNTDDKDGKIEAENLDETLSKSVILLRQGYLMFGSPGCNESDDCFRLSVIDGYKYVQ